MVKKRIKPIIWIELAGLIIIAVVIYSYPSIMNAIRNAQCDPYNLYHDVEKCDLWTVYYYSDRIIPGTNTREGDVERNITTRQLSTECPLNNQYKEIYHDMGQPTRWVMAGVCIQNDRSSRGIKCIKQQPGFESCSVKYG